MPRYDAEQLTEGSLLKPLLALSAPVVLTQGMQVLYNLVDVFWVGQLGAAPLSAVSFSWAIIYFVVRLGDGFALAGTVLVAQNTGARNDDRTGFIAGQALALNLLASVVVGVVGYLFAPHVLSLVGTTPGTEIHRMGVEYIRVVLLGLPFTFGFYAFQSLLRGRGDTWTPMYIVLATVALNVVLDPLLIFGFEGNPLLAGVGGLEATLYALTGFDGLHVTGAALATVLARGTATLVALWLLFSGRTELRLRLSDFRLRLGKAKRILGIALPASVEFAAEAFSVTVMAVVVALVGSDAVAAFGVGNRFTSLAWLPAVGLGMGVETVVGQNLGAGRPDRARRAVSLGCGVVVAVFLVVSTAVFLLAVPIMSLFVAGGSGAVVPLGAEYLRIVGATYAFVGVYHVVNGGFHGAGSTRVAMYVGVGGLSVVRVGVSLVGIVVFAAGATGAWVGVAVSHVVVAVFAGAWFLRDGWLEAVVGDDPETTPAD